MALDPIDVCLRSIVHGFRASLRELRAAYKHDDPQCARIDAIISNTKHDGDVSMSSKQLDEIDRALSEGAPTKADILSALYQVGRLIAQARNLLADGLVVTHLGGAMDVLGEIRHRIASAEEAKDEPAEERCATAIFNRFKQTAGGHSREDVIAACLRMMEYAHWHHDKAPRHTQAESAASRMHGVDEARNAEAERTASLESPMQRDARPHDELDAELSSLFNRDTRALEAAHEIENIFARGHTGGTTQRLARIQCIVNDAMDSVAMRRPLTPDPFRSVNSQRAERNAQEDAAHYDRGATFVPKKDFVSLSERLAGLHTRERHLESQSARFAAAATAYEGQLRRISEALGVGSILDEMIMPAIDALKMRSMTPATFARLEMLEQDNRDLERARDLAAGHRDALQAKIRELYVILAEACRI